MQNLPNSRIVPIGKAAEILGVSIDTLRRWDKAGKITSVRPDGKDRYFNTTELEKIKANKPLSISEASKKLGVSSSTLRRYEKKGIIKPKRNEQGERIYEEDLIRNFSLKPSYQEIPEAKKKTKKNFFSGKAWQYPPAFIVVVFLITTIFSTLYIEERYQANKEKISMAASRVLGAKDQGGIIGFFAGIGEKYKLVLQTIQKTIVEKTVVEKTTEIQKLIVDEKLIKNLNAELLQGREPGTDAGDIAYFLSGGVIAGLDIESANLSAGSVSGGAGGIILDSSITASDLADNAVTTSKILNDTIKNEDIHGSAINSEKIEDNTVSASDLASTLTFDNGDLVDLSGITHSSTSKMGLILPNVSSATPTSPSSGEGYIAWDTSGNQIVIYNGSSWSTVAGGTGSGDITSVVAGNGLTGGGIINDVTLTVLLTSTGTTGSTSSNSGLEVSASGLTLLKGCADNEILKWTDSGGWACAADNSGSAGISTIEENDGSIVASATNIDFLGSDFIVGAVSTEGNISIDYPNSGITRNNVSETINNDWTFTLAGTEDFAITHDLAGTANMMTLTGTPNASANTAYGIYIDQANSANANGLDAALVIDNSDASGAVIGAAIKTIDAGAGFTSLFDINGTLISVTEFTILDGGIALSELTDSGTLTAGTVDINGGAIDGTTVGANSASTGAFSTLSATGDITMNDAGADTILIGQSGTTDDTVTIAGNVSITDDNWAISDTGIGTGLTANDLSCTNCIGATEVDESTIASTGLSDTADIGYLNQSETVVNDWTFTLAGTEDLAITHDLAGTANMMTLTGTPNASANTAYGIYIDQANSANANGLDAALVIDNSDTSGAVIGAAIKTIDAGAGFTNLFDIAGTLITSAEFTILDGGIALSELTDSGTLTAGTVDINGGAIDGVTIGANSAAAGTFNAVTSTGAIAANSASGITSNQATLIINAGGTVDVQDALTVDSLDTGGAEALALGNTNANAVSICNSATCDTITIGTNNDADTITIGEVNDTNVSITDDNWSIGVTGIITTSGVINANGGITFDHAADTVGAHTLSGTLDANSNIITKIGATTTNFTTSGSLAIGLDAADTNGALMVDNVAQANPVLVAKDNGTIVWQVGDSGLITVDPAATGIIENIALATQWTTGTIINAAFASATTQTAAEIGLAFDLSTYNTVPNSASGNQTGILLTLKDGGASATSTAISLAGTYDTAILIGGTVGTNILDSSLIDISAAGAIDTESTIQAGTSGITLTLASGYIDADAITLASSGTTGSTSSRSGLQTSSDGLTLLMGCTDGELLEWTDSGGWVCAADDTSAGAGISTVEEQDVSKTGVASRLDFNGTDFVITSEDTNAEARIDIDYANSGITRLAENVTITGDWAFSLGAGKTIDISASAAPTTDMFTVVNTEQGTTTTAIDGIQLDFVTSAVAGSVNNSALRINVTSGATEAGDSLEAVNIGNLSGQTGVETAVKIGTGWDNEIDFEDSTPTIKLGATDNTAVFSIVDSNATPQTLFEIRDYATNVGSLVTAGGFLGTMSYFQEEFNNDSTTALTSDNALQIGDYGATAGGAWYFDTTTAAGSLSYAVQDNLGGFARIATGTTNPAAGLIGFGSAQGNLSLIFAKANLPILQMKVRVSSTAVTNDLIWGFAGTAAATAVATNDTLPAEGIFFWGSNGSSWVGVVRSGSANVGTVTCGGSISTSQFAVGRIQVESATSVRFLIDNDASDGVQFTDCGTVSGANPTAALGIIFHAIQTSVSSVNNDLDYVRVWQDDVGDASATAGSEPPLIIETPSFDSKQVLADLMTDTDPDILASSITSLSRVDIGILTALGAIVTPELTTNKLFANEIFANKIHANQIEGLTFLANQIISEKFTQALNVLDAQTATDSAVLGSADTNLEIDNLIANKGLTVWGLAKFMDGVTFSGAVSYMGDVTFERIPTFTSDTAGFAVIKQGSSEVRVDFSEEYADVPVVSASPLWDADKATVDTVKQLGAYVLPKQEFIIASVDRRGFTIVLEEPAVTDLKFSWFALAVKEAKTVNGAIPTPTATLIPTPEITLMPSPTITPITVPEATPSSTVEPATESGVFPE